MTPGHTISNDPLFQRTVIGSENRAAPLSATASGSEFLKSILAFSSSSGVQDLSASLPLERLARVFRPSEPSRANDRPPPNRNVSNRNVPDHDFSDRKPEDQDRQATSSANRESTPTTDRPQPVPPESDVTALPIYSPGFLNPDSDRNDHPAIGRAINSNRPESELAGFSRRDLDPATRSDTFPITNTFITNTAPITKTAAQPGQPLPLTSASSPWANGGEGGLQGLANGMRNLDPRILYRSSVSSEGAIAIDSQTLATSSLNSEAKRALTDLLKSATGSETNQAMDAVTPEAKSAAAQNQVLPNPNRVAGTAAQAARATQAAISPAELSAAAHTTDVDAEGAVEISFKPDKAVSQTSDSNAPLRNERRAQNRTGSKATMIGQHPGGAERGTPVYTRMERPGRVNPIALGGPEFSLGELQVLPVGQRAVLESGMGQAMVPPSWNDPASQALIGAQPFSADVGSPESALVAAPTAFGTPANMEALVNTTMVTPGVADFRDADTVVQEVAAGSKTVSSRLLQQVAQALRQTPATDSTMRLQLNPAELGQLAIEITFRDGAMHGKLRAEHGATFKLLQEGLEGLRARLSEQGIVVNTLEVELGQQGDFSQQQRSFPQAQDFGRQRHSNGYFSTDDRAARRAAVEKETPSGAAPVDTSGRWAVNVIV